MTYSPITPLECLVTGLVRKSGYRAAAITRELSRYRSTITREIRRNERRRNGIGYYPL